MPLDARRQQEIRDEEFFRDEVRKELTRRSPSGLVERLSAFFDSKAGFWLLTTVLAALWASGLTYVNHWYNRAEIREQAVAENARRDTAAVLQLTPLLSSEDKRQINVAIILLDGLTTGNAINSKLGKDISRIWQDAIKTGEQSGATPSQKALRDQLLAFADAQALPNGAQNTSANEPLSAPSAIDNVKLPIRIYMRVANRADQEALKFVVPKLVGLGIIVPEVETVEDKRVPAQNQLRYCKNKIDDASLARVTAAVAAAIQPAPTMIALDASQCGNVRVNHYELWYRQSR